MNPVPEQIFLPEEIKIAVALNLKEIQRRGRMLFKAREHLTVSQWAEKYRYVTREESPARPGPWDNSIQPFGVEIMDSFNEPEVEEITAMCSAQVIKTEALKNMIGYVITERPAPMLVVYPADGDARDFSTEKLEPMLNNNRCFEGKLFPAKNNSKENKTLYKKYKGGFLAIAGGKAPQQLARRSVMYVFIDDADRVTTAGGEGDAAALAWERTESLALFGRKKVMFSTPTIDGLSRIQKAYELSDMRQCYLPCPFCGHMQTLKFDNLKWEKETDLLGNVTGHLPETAKYECENCKELIEEKHKPYMVANHVWKPKHPERVHHRGYWINRLYSSFSTWAQIVKKFLDVKDDPEKLQVFMNTVLALPWKMEVENPVDENVLLERVEDYLTDENPRIPNDIVLLTMAVDTQDDRVEIAVEGWTASEENYLIHYEQIFGMFQSDELKKELDDFIFKRRWTREDGVQLALGCKLNGRRYYAVFIDTQGHQTQAVYDYTRTRQHLGILGIRGKGGNLLAVNSSSLCGKFKDTIVYNLGVDTIKPIIWQRLSLPTRDKDNKIIHAPFLCHFTKEFCNENYFKMLLSEKPFKIYGPRGTQIRWETVPKGARNEAWDLKVYNYAAFRSCTPAGAATLNKLKEAYLKKAEEIKTQKTTVKEVVKEPVVLKKQTTPRGTPMRSRFTRRGY